MTLKLMLPAAALSALASASHADEMSVDGSGPQLIAFDGVQQLTQAASRQRMLTQMLGYTLTVDAAGNATECTLSRKFRRKATELALCRPLLRFSRFEPARDAAGNAVEGTYSGTIDFKMLMSGKGLRDESAGY